MTGNNETLDHLRRLLLHRELTGSVTLHCRSGRIEDIEVRERVPPPWKERLNEAKDRATQPD